jgi:hypothetical protein
MLRQTEGLRPARHFKGWLKEQRHEHIGNLAFASLRDGGCVNPKWIRLLLEYCLDSRIRVSADARRALNDYCAALGLPRPLDKLLDAISTPCERVALREPATDAGYIDELREYAARLGPAGLATLVTPLQQTCPPPAQGNWIDQISEWIYVEHGRQHAGRRLYAHEARELASTKIGTPLSHYRQRMHEWIEREPWTVALANVRGRFVGGSIVLPVTKECYSRLLGGDLNTWQISGTDLRAPSEFVVGEALAMRPLSGAQRARRRSLDLMLTIMSQVAHLSAVDGAGEDVPIQLLSADFSRDSQWRLSRSGFAVSSTTLAGTAVSLRSRTISITANGTNHNAIADSDWFGLLRVLQRTFA